MTVTVTVLGYLILISIDFYDFISIHVLSLVLVSIEKINFYIKHSRQCLISYFQTPRSWSEILRCASYFQLSSWCLEMLLAATATISTTTATAILFGTSQFTFRDKITALFMFPCNN